MTRKRYEEDDITGITDIEKEIYMLEKAKYAGFKSTKSYTEYRINFVAGVIDWFVKNQILDIDKMSAVTKEKIILSNGIYDAKK